MEAEVRLHKEGWKVACKSCGGKLGPRKVCMNESCPMYLIKQNPKKGGSAMAEMLTKMSPEK